MFEMFRRCFCDLFELKLEMLSNRFQVETLIILARADRWALV